MWCLFYYCYHFFFFLRSFILRLWHATNRNDDFLRNTMSIFSERFIHSTKATVLRRKFMPCTMGELATLSANFSAANTLQVLKIIKKKKVQRADSV